MKTNYTLQDAQKFAQKANINGVNAFLHQEDAKEYDHVTIEVLLESLMTSYIRSIEIDEFEIDRFCFANIKRIANMKVEK